MAGPDVFLPNVLEIAAQKKKILHAYGFEGLHPFDNDVDFSKHSREGVSRIIKEANCDMMRRADIILANLTPYHGPSGDAGTDYEVGFMDALNKPVFAYSNVTPEFLERVREFNGGSLEQDANGFFRDRFNMAVENFGLTDNLMLEWAWRKVPERRITLCPTSEEERYTSLVAFEQAARLMAQEMLGRDMVFPQQGNRRWSIWPAWPRRHERVRRQQDYRTGARFGLHNQGRGEAPAISGGQNGHSERIWVRGLARSFF
jgi:nucleoside 2-deoxyribosyltransferase